MEKAVARELWDILEVERKEEEESSSTITGDSASNALMAQVVPGPGDFSSPGFRLVGFLWRAWTVPRSLILGDLGLVVGTASTSQDIKSS
jgi:hypothetical protein